MLESLHIENIAVIERADVEFCAGFNVLTGETGAGKSMIIDSINAILGERTSRELIRAGCEKALVSAVFSDIPQAAEEKLRSLGFSAVGGEVMITRTLSDSKSGAKINGVNATAAVLREIAPLLINIHGQHDSQQLLNADSHYLYVDLCAQNSALLEQYRAAFSDMQSTRKRLKMLTDAVTDKQNQIDLLTFQVNELEAADVRHGEVEEFKARRDVINNAKNILDALTGAYAALNGVDDEFSGAVQLCDDASGSLIPVTKYSAEASKINDSLCSVKYSLEELRDEIDSLRESMDFDGEELENIEQRLEMYYRLTKKYNADEDGLLAHLENAKATLKSIEISDEEIIRLGDLLKIQVGRVKELGATLTDSRKTAGEMFADSVAKQLEFLDMPKVRLLVDVSDAPYSHTGANRVEFLISTNPGEPFKPLARIASGGEMSRIMLAIKNVLSTNDPVCTMIFDEIDTGISGRAATKVGIKLKEVSSGKQVICVTHLAQIAAMADNHLLISKDISSGRAVTTVTLLDFEQRKREIARIIGSDASKANLASAEEMLKKTY